MSTEEKDLGEILAWNGKLKGDELFFYFSIRGGCLIFGKRGLTLSAPGNPQDSLQYDIVFKPIEEKK